MVQSFEEFCGGSLWDETRLLNGNYPEFTDCFQQTLLVWVPCGFLWLSAPFYLYHLLNADGVSRPHSFLSVAKTFVSGVLFFLSIVELLRDANNKDDEEASKRTHNSLFVAHSLKAATFLLTILLIYLERIRGFITSGVLFIFWLLMLVASIIPFYTLIEQDVYHKDFFRFSIFYVYFFLIVVQFVLHCFAEKITRRGYYELNTKQCLEVEASFLSRLTFWWMTGLIIIGYKKPLEEADISELHPRDKSDVVIPTFDEAWKKEYAKHEKIREKSVKYSRPAQSINQEHRSSEKTPLLSRQPSVTFKTGKPVKKENKGSLFKVLCKIYGPSMLRAWFCKFMYDLMQFTSPILLSALIGYTTNKKSGKNVQPEWHGYTLAGAFFIVSFLQSTFFHQNFHIGMSTGMRARSAMIAAVYKKSLTMNNEARKTSTVGEIVNIMGVDCQRLQDMSGYLWMLWSAPFQITLATLLLWQQLGPSVLAGLAVMILLIPLNAAISVKQRNMQTALMRYKDARLKLMNEVLSGIKVLKLYAWEQSFQQKIIDIRNKELGILKSYGYLQAFSTFSFTCAPFLVTLASFATYVLISDENYLDAQKAFVSLSLFNILRFPINLLPMMISYVIQLNVSITRLSKFLKNGDLDPDNVQHRPLEGVAIKVEGGTFSWDKELQPALKDIDLEVKEGKLVAVVGTVGAGKSSLISAFLGEMEKLNGNVNVKGSIAYVPQQAWIQNATVRDNILFGKEMDECKYNNVVESCALKSDFEILTGGDLTEIGEKGINLSGGQKQRVSLARAVYNNADVYMLDDPLSAVDSHVGKHIFKNVIGREGLLQNKTRVLVTHGIHWLPMVDTVVVMSDGVISEMGSYEELMSHEGPFAQFLKAYLIQKAETEDDEEEEEEDPEIQQMKSKILERLESVTSDTGTATSGDESKVRKRSSKGHSKKSALSRGISTFDALECKPLPTPKKDKKDVEKLIEDEKREKGKVAWKVFMMYLRAIGLVAAFWIFVLYLLYQGASIASNIWLSQWTDDKQLQDRSKANTTEYKDRNMMFLGVYGGLGIVQGIMVLIYSLVAILRQVRASAQLHYDMLNNIMKAPMAFFDTTPVGRIVNRFSSDVATIDSMLPMNFRMFLGTVIGTLSTLVVISYSTPIFLTVVLPLAIVYYLMQKFYIPTSRQLQRLESTTKSPIFNHFSETINGASTLRAYKEQPRFIQESLDRVDKNISFYFTRIASNRWLGWRLEFIGNLIVFSAALFAVVSDISGGLVGLSVSYALQITSALNMLVRNSSDLETNVVSVERLKEYAEVETEAEWIRPFRRPPHDWPQSGACNFMDYKTRYREGLDLVIRGITCQIQGGEKVGIVGRTGAGKSSLMMALFRLIEASDGSIVIDGQRISDMGLHDLRSKLTILPQDPVLFSGTLRMNLDPFDQYADSQIWTSLEHAHLKKFVSELPERLSHECGEGGGNLSVGQRQLICLARTLLRKTKILVLDEATAAVDMETDELIQKTIREEFKDCTILTIAHRLNTILDYDKVMVLDQGLIKEYDSPDSLLKDKTTVFYGMAKAANIVS
ncbi:multidrug resistance-associated protein 1-like [Mytilus californianus]|uniref:multidrug resistance-associated protein 1-like n=1 Tax=Mytilus californianus TaxID=6549 RepID=UPI0022462DC5|nr:multidrug resistance-associated protein 1-like [Mytilus californianus]